MAETLLEKANRLQIQPQGQPESLVQKAQRLGIEPQKGGGYFQRVGQAYSKEGESIISGIKKGAEDIQSGNILSGIVRPALETVGGVARATFAPILEAPIIKPAIEFVVSKALTAPKIQEVVSESTKLAQKYPQQARDVQNIIDIVSLGYAPKATGVVAKEAKLIGTDISQATNVLLTPPEEAIQAKVIDLFQRSIKPAPKKTLIQAQRYENDTLNALKTIKSNADNLNIEDATGELVSRTPETVQELSQALDQTKGLVFNQYNDLAKRAGGMGVTIDAKPIAEEVAKVTQNKALQLTNPDVIKYAESWAERLRGFDTLDTETTQEVIKLMNNNLQAFYRNPTYDTASKVAVDAGIANNFRQALDKAIEGATGEQYQVLKSQYSALKAIENDVIKASQREARKNIKGLLDYTDILTGGQMVGGILSLNPAMFTKGAIERGFKEYLKFLNDPNRAISNIFDNLNIETKTKFSPQSATGKFIKNPKLGMSIEDVSKSASKIDDTLLQEARKYKSAEEFVKAQPKTVRVWNKSKFSNDGAYVDIPVIRKEENITLYQGGKTGDGRQFWTPDKKYAEQFGVVKEKTGAFYKIDNGNRVTDVYVEAPTKSQLTDIWKKANKK